MDIDFIKWMCEESADFEYREDIRGKNIIWHSPYRNWTEISGVEGIERRSFYPLLLQRSIEGVNRDGIANIEQLSECIEVIYGMNVPCFKWESSSIDKAKEASLKYIYEQENLIEQNN